MYTPEGKVKASVKKLLDQHGIYYFMPATGGYGRSGVPDFIGCARGRFFSIEAKAGKAKPTALQLREMERIKAAGGLAFVINEETIDDLYYLTLPSVTRLPR
jgi:Holliday junction resolvase